MPGIVSYGAYLPYWRLQRSAIGADARQRRGQGRPQRRELRRGHDVDGRRGRPHRPRRRARRLRARAAAFATTAPAYVDKTNATAIHAALGLPSHGAGARRRRRRALRRRGDRCWPAPPVASPSLRRRPHRPARRRPTSGRRRRRGALAFGERGRRSPRSSAAASATAEFLDRWRLPARPTRRCGRSASASTPTCRSPSRPSTAALKAPASRLDDVDHVIVTGLHTRAVGGGDGRSACGPRRSSTTSSNEVGNTGTAHWALLLADVLDRAEPGQRSPSCCSPTAATSWIRETTDRVAGATARRRSVRDRDRGHPRRSRLPDVPHVARLPPARAAAPARPGVARRRRRRPAPRRGSSASSAAA